MSHLPITGVLVFFIATTARAGDWTNNGGNAGRNGLSDEIGPLAGDVLWSGSRSSIIAWQPVTEGGKVFLVRQNAFVPTNTPNDAPVVCQDLDTGAELWARHIPYASGDWTTWIAGARDGKVYASRSGNGASVAARMYALDADDGSTVWTSGDAQRGGPYDGVVFAPDGDLIVAWHTRIRRIDADTGATVWSANRVGSVSGNCGVALHGDALYAAEVVPGGHAIQRFDLATGAALHVGPTMPGFTLQNTPMVGPDGTVYLSRTQNNVITDFFYAFTDTGSALVEKWNVPAGWSTSSEFAVGPDGSVYMVAPGNVLARLDPATGVALDTTAAPIGGGTPRLAVDCDGRVYLSNGGFPDGELYAFNADLSARWSVQVPNINIGAPCLGEGGTLVVAGIGTNVVAYRSLSAWADLRAGLAGVAGVPVFEATGSLEDGSALAGATKLALSLSASVPGGLATLVVGASAVLAPFKGGTLVPAPTVLLFLPLDGAGGYLLETVWPVGVPAGLSLWMQNWMADAAGPQGFAASNAVVGVTS